MDHRPVAFGMPVLLLTGLVLAACGATTRLDAAAAVRAAANAWLETLDVEQKASGLRPFAEAARTDWHFVPKASRKGVQLRDMTALQRTAALALLRSALSAAGYAKAQEIMLLEEMLRVLEGAGAKNIRDPERYYVTLFGTPAATGEWGLSFEGHHLSFNLTIRDDRIVDSTPQFMGANPAIVKTSVPGTLPAGHRVLAAEEQLAFDIVRSLDAAQRSRAVVPAEPPAEIRAAGRPQPPLDPAIGIRFADLRDEQRRLVRDLVAEYCGAMPAEVAAERLKLIEDAVARDGGNGWDAVRFAWWGSLEPGVGHAYRVEGPTFVIEFVNVQPDAEGNPANHIHCVWRDRTGDFGLPPS